MPQNHDLIVHAEELLDEIDALISDHVINAQNRVETGWEMRGLIDCLTGKISTEYKRDELYGEDYRDGIKAALALKATGLTEFGIADEQAETGGR